MQAGFFNLFLGLLFQFNIVVKGIDVLPDVVGYYFIYKGLKVLANKNQYFETANKLVIPLMVLSLANFYNFTYHEDLLLTLSFPLDILKIIVFALNMYLIYNLCKGSAVVSASLNAKSLERALTQRLTFYLIVAGILLILSILSLLPFTEVDAALQATFTIVYFAYLLVMVVIIVTIQNVHKQLSPVKVKSIKSKGDGKPVMKIRGKAGKRAVPSRSKR